MNLELKRFFFEHLKRFGIEIRRFTPRGKETFPNYVDSDFNKHYFNYCHDSMVPWQGVFDAYLAARFVALSEIEGDIVECGVWRGGVSALMKDTVDQYNSERQSRSFWLFDTFEGMSEPGKFDFKRGRNAADTQAKQESLRKLDGTSGWCRGDLSDVKKTMSRTTTGLNNVIFVKGMVEKTLELNLPNRIALLRLDTDFYESTKAELEFLYPRLSKGGVLIIDDYGAWAGARKAFDDYFTVEKKKEIFIAPNHYYGSLCCVKIK